MPTQKDPYSGQRFRVGTGEDVNLKQRVLEGELVKFLKEDAKVRGAKEMFSKMNESLQSVVEAGGFFGDLKAEGEELKSMITAPFTESLIPELTPLIEKVAPLIEKIVNKLLPAVEWFVDVALNIIDAVEKLNPLNLLGGGRGDPTAGIDIDWNFERWQDTDVSDTQSLPDKLRDLEGWFS